jgi:Gpi18-like mannosyltransferase
MNKSHLVKIVLLGICLKALYVGFAFFVEAIHADFTFAHDYAGIIDLFKRNDTYWYKNIHENGYPEVTSKLDLGWHNGPEFHQSSWGFMPGYPLATQTVSLMFNTNFESSAFILSIVFSLTCFMLFYWLATLWFDKTGDAFFATVLFMVMPFQYYFSMMYTEAYFCMLLIGALLAVVNKNHLALILSTSLMVIIRANGLVMLLPLALFIIENESPENGPIKTKLRNSMGMLSMLVFPILSFAGYGFYQYYHTGYFFAYSIAQQGGWYREMMFPLAGLFRSGDFVSQFNSWYAIVFMVIAVLSWKRLSWSFNIIVWLNVLLPLSAGASTGMTRYVTIIFPFFLMFAFWLKNEKWKMALIPLFVGIQLYTFYFWLVSDSFSY